MEAFLDHIALIKRYSAHTVTAYRRDLMDYSTYLDEVYGIVLLSASKLHVRSYIVRLVQDGVSKRSINRKISTLKSFYKYCCAEGRIELNPMRSIRMFKTPKRLPEYVQATKIDKTVAVSESVNFVEVVADLVVSLLYSTGMRRSELLNLTIDDLHLSDQTVKVLGKGNKERILPLPASCISTITHYLTIRQETFGVLDHSYLIVTPKGRPAYPKYIYNLVYNRLAAHNASDKKSPHVLRHSYATHLLDNGADINAIKELLGHANLAATQVYTHMTLKKLKAVYDRSHPKSK